MGVAGTVVHYCVNPYTIHIKIWVNRCKQDVGIVRATRPGAQDEESNLETSRLQPS
jgi:hypothetical protein